MCQDERRAKMEEKQGHTPTKNTAVNINIINMAKKVD